MTENNNTEHTIKIDNYIDMKIKIPQELDVLEFNSLLEKARKLLKLGNIEVGTRKRKYLTGDDKRMELIRDYETTPREGRQKLAEKYCYSSVMSLDKSYYRAKTLLKDTLKQTLPIGKKIVNKDKQKKLIDGYYSCKDIDEKIQFAKKLSLTISQLYARVSYYKKINKYKKKKLKGSVLKEDTKNDKVRTTPLYKYSDELIKKIITLIKQKKGVKEISDIIIREDGIKDMTPKKVYDIIFNRTGKRIEEIRNGGI